MQAVRVKQALLQQQQKDDVNSTDDVIIARLLKVETDQLENFICTQVMLNQQ